MSARVATFTFTRPGILVPGILAAVFLAKGWLVVGFVCALIAVTKSARLLGDADLDTRLRDRDELRAHGVRRLLSNGERQEMDQLADYARILVSHGGEPALGREVREKAWDIVRAAGWRDATVELKRFRQSLPELSRAKLEPEETLQRRLERELDLLRAGQRELSG